MNHQQCPYDKLVKLLSDFVLSVFLSAAIVRLSFGKWTRRSSSPVSNRLLNWSLEKISKWSTETENWKFWLEDDQCTTVCMWTAVHWEEAVVQTFRWWRPTEAKSSQKKKRYEQFILATLAVRIRTKQRTPALQFVREIGAKADLQWQERAHSLVQFCLLQYHNYYQYLRHPADLGQTSPTGRKHRFTS